MSAPLALVVDDEPDIARLYARALAGAGFVVDTAGRVDEGEALIRSREYALLVCDLRLPDGDGLLLAAVYRQLRPAGKIIVVTGSMITDTGKKAVIERADRLLVKPCGPGELRRAVLSIMGPVERPEK